VARDEIDLEADDPSIHINECSEGESSLLSRDGQSDMTIESMDSSSDVGYSGTEYANHLATDGSALRGECIAPPGKLGIAIDTWYGQPVVHRVKEDSPLAGVLRRLDVILAVDDVDTSQMTAADVTGIMAKSIDRKRKITVYYALYKHEKSKLNLTCI
jgi:C-terminal processing protease CtpA/Prc